MTEWVADTNNSGPPMTIETLRRGFELLREGVGKVEPHRVHFRGIIFECGDPRLRFMMENNIMNYKELMEKYPND